jgi:hypothetical protein
MGKGFKRVSLVGSEELFRATKPQNQETDEVIAEVVDRKPPPAAAEKHLMTVHLTPAEVELMLEAIQVAKYPDRPRPKPSLDKHERLDQLRGKLQGEG